MAEPNLLPRIIKGYRWDEKRDQLETLPTKLDRRQVIDLAKNMDTSISAGMPKIGKDQLVNKILKEGRSDAGANEYNTNNRQAVDLYNRLVASDVSPLGARYAAATLDKSQVASRLGIPIERAWNGTGRNAETKKTGDWHAKTAEIAKQASSSPKNSELVDLVSRAASGDLTPEENVLHMSASDSLLKALLNLQEPATEQRNGSTFYTKAAVNAASDKLASARKQASLAERKDSKLLFGSDVLYGLVPAYQQAAGVAPNETVRGIAPEASDPMMKYLTGNFTSSPAAPEPPGILDRIISLFK